MEAVDILRRIKNTPQDIFRYSESDFDRAIDEINSLIKKVEESKSYFDLKLDGNFEEENLNNRSCSNCKYVIKDTLGYKYCNCAASPLSSCIFALHPYFCCNKWESK